MCRFVQILPMNPFIKYISHPSTANALQKITVLGSTIERTFFHLDDNKISVQVKDTVFIGSGIIIDPDVDNINNNTDNNQTVTIETSTFEGQFHLSAVNVKNCCKSFQ